MYKVLQGDKSDNIPGISGVGKKTAQKFIPIKLKYQTENYETMISELFVKNKNKELIGVNTFTTAKTETLNFAVSVDDLVEFLNEVQQEEIESQYIKKKTKVLTNKVSKKKIKLAVERNVVRRRIKEAYRLQKNQLDITGH